jgi:acid phosphatase type 7
MRKRLSLHLLFTGVIAFIFFAPASSSKATSSGPVPLITTAPPVPQVASAASSTTIFLPLVVQDYPAVFVGAGDIGSCDTFGDEATANLLDQIPGTVFTLGDNVYNTGATSEFNNCYASAWGRHLARTRPASGNHDYLTLNASAYFGYFGAAAGNPAVGYYSYDLGYWHIIVINSNCALIGGCQAGSVQEQWLRSDLAAHPALCTLAYWHHPRFSSGLHGDTPAMQPLWQALYDYNAEVVLNGHDHDYERFALQDPTGAADSAQGLREFVVGTGGRSHYAWQTVKPNSEARNNTTFGVLQLTLYSSSYAWKFVPEQGKTFTDTGRTDCH